MAWVWQASKAPEERSKKIREDLSAKTVEVLPKPTVFAANSVWKRLAKQYKTHCPFEGWCRGSEERREGGACHKLSPFESQAA